MNMPRFTGEASLYKTNGHYQTDRRAINSSEQEISAIYLPAMKIDETINIHGCQPGYTLWEGAGGSWGCNPPPPLTEPPIIWPGGGWGEPVDSGQDPHPPTIAEYDPSEGGRCKAKASGLFINVGTYRYDKTRDDYSCCGPRIHTPSGDFVRQDCVACQDNVRRCQNRSA